MVVLSETGRIHGEVIAAHLVVSGHIHGPVRAVDLIELQPRARIVGDVRYRALEMHHGAIVQGQMIHLSADGTQETPMHHEVNVPAE
jgi:cytoskeletal protein CcmA (bactofilin family)